MTMQVQGQHPDVYAQFYADSKGISLDDAKEELKEQYGDPVQDAAGSVFTGQFQSCPPPPFDFNSMGADNMSQGGQNGFLDGLKNIGHAIGQLLHLGGGEETQSGQMSEMRPIPDFTGDGPQNEGDPQPHLTQTSNPFGDSTIPKQDPDAYAQYYADANGLTLEEAKAELKEKYGDPQQK